ncbi:hypothetical protein HPSA50_1646 [Helicobacter pylori SouthAfrica50]|uniref:Uncharacterized protein n=1 Tax=Helicobacter pylori SouthAfrica50 TaxID=1352357 RepID=T2S9D5_HELPX|nr:hypothetical protein HPSA50_1646 [Helicobacter pylori SouthAfrica50]
MNFCFNQTLTTKTFYFLQNGILVTLSINKTHFLKGIGGTFCALTLPPNPQLKPP